MRIFLSVIFLLIASVDLSATEQKVHSVQRYIEMANNDAEEYFDGKVNISSSDLEMTLDDLTQSVGLRFTDIDVPKGAKIVRSYIQFETDEISTAKTSLIIYAQDCADAGFFISKPYGITARKKTAQKVIWEPFSWMKKGERSFLQRTPDLSVLVQTIVDKKHWKLGNAMVFIIKGTGKRVAKAFTDNKPENIGHTACLHIDYMLQTDSMIAKENTDTASSVKSIKTDVSPKVTINEILAANRDTNYAPDSMQYEDWIELYNPSKKPVDISGWHLSDDHERLQKWTFPPDTVLQPSGYLLVWADALNDRQKALHTNFKLRQKGGALFLSDKEGSVVDSLYYPKQKADISYAKSGYMFPTPKKANQTAYATAKRTKKPKSSQKSGFYEKPLKIALKSEENASIYYTLDGTRPTTDAMKYIEPISIEKTTIIRAVAMKRGKFSSRIVTHSYFYDENFSIPVVSLVCDKDDLYDERSGIVANYEQKWMREASVEYFEKGKSKFLKDAGLKISGNNTRRYPRKSFAIYFKKKYGAKSLHYALFPDKPYIKKVRSFTLRNSGTYIEHSLISEGISHMIVKDTMDIDYQSFQPAILFLNGKYWGIYNIRERMNRAYIEANHHVKDIDLIENNEFSDAIKAGSIDAYYELIDEIRTRDMREQKAFSEVTDRIDIKEFINHVIVESYFGNSSIQHNVKRWRPHDKKGKWRTLLFDLDRGFDKPTDPVLGYVMDESSTNLFFTHFIQNKSFTQKFVSRYFTHLNLTFKPKRVASFITKYKNMIAPYVQRHFKRWQFDSDDRRVSEQTWQQYIDALYLFAQKREEIVREKLKKAFDLKKSVHLKIDKVRNGTVYLDDIRLAESFEGEYFQGATVTLRAEPEKGYLFEGWSNGDHNATTEIMLRDDMQIYAKFTKKTE